MKKWEVVDRLAYRLLGRHANGISTYKGNLEDARYDCTALLDELGWDETDRAVKEIAKLPDHVLHYLPASTAAAFTELIRANRTDRAAKTFENKYARAE